MGRSRVGISGWRYEGWRGVFYPEELKQDAELSFASRQLTTLEINGTFYSLQKPESFERWYAESPAGFVFSVKGGRFLTHIRKLKDIDEALANFFASGVLALRDKLGPFLWQFPEVMPCDLPRFEAFFAQLPRDTAQAAQLARRHDARMGGRSLTGTDHEGSLRHAIEIRNEACAVPAFFELLRKHRIAWVIADTAGRWPYAEDVTSDFLYLRLHGDKELYASGYSDEAIARWADRVQTWGRGEEPTDATRIGGAAPVRKAGRDVFVYFDNDVKAHAPFDALALHRALGLQAPEGQQPDLAARRRPVTKVPLAGPRLRPSRFRGRR